MKNHRIYNERLVSRGEILISKKEVIENWDKKMFDSDATSYSTQMREKKMVYRVLAYDCHRACMIDCVVLAMISMKL